MARSLGKSTKLVVIVSIRSIMVYGCGIGANGYLKFASRGKNQEYGSEHTLRPRWRLEPTMLRLELSKVRQLTSISPNWLTSFPAQPQSHPRISKQLPPRLLLSHSQAKSIKLSRVEPSFPVLTPRPLYHWKTRKIHRILHLSMTTIHSLTFPISKAQTTMLSGGSWLVRIQVFSLMSRCYGSTTDSYGIVENPNVREALTPKLIS
ncbi:Ethylene-responsive transcription factor [Actinidia chinensis var. chinensis]|uniref:Ethylene-responsive transcription factor n=1 Tax=Actinidia chinensis var. chinensis TaxID=1590841 RepID=A0A2R6QPM4_ACTCC|nr:Ethylene-responsive transcription factor [Actinidia chinensis var. chinensis]